MSLTSSKLSTLAGKINASVKVEKKEKKVEKVEVKKK